LGMNICSPENISNKNERTNVEEYDNLEEN
jgi:hypothetical protein